MCASSPQPRSAALVSLVTRKWQALAGICHGGQRVASVACLPHKEYYVKW